MHRRGRPSVIMKATAMMQIDSYPRARQVAGRIHLGAEASRTFPRTYDLFGVTYEKLERHGED